MGEPIANAWVARCFERRDSTYADLPDGVSVAGAGLPADVTSHEQTSGSVSFRRSALPVFSPVETSIPSLRFDARNMEFEREQS